MASSADTYQKDLIDIMRGTFEMYLVPSEIMVNMNLDSGVKERILGIERQEKRQEAVAMLLDEVLLHPQKSISPFIFALRRAGFRHFIEILDDEPGNKNEDKRAKKFKMLIMLLQGDLKDYIVPSEIIDDLKGPTEMSDRDYERIRRIERMMSPHDAFEDLMLVIQRKTDKWALHFLEAIHKRLDPEFILKITDEYDISLRATEVDDDAMLDIDADDVDMSDAHPGDIDQTIRKDVAYETVQEAADHSSMTREQRMHMLSLESDLNSMSLSQNGRQSMVSVPRERIGESLISMPRASGARPQQNENEGPKDGGDEGIPDMNLREYQKELADYALQGKNTIICAPTGSGKTRVALHLILKHLENKGPRAKVVFLARTVPLVSQQFRDCLRYLSSTYKITKLTGEDEGSMYMHSTLNMFDVFVLTPQILLNQLKEGLITSLSVFTMLILDECHHTRKGEPYNHIMLNYLKQKQRMEKSRRRGVEDQTQLPQIVGLTASLGVEKATTDQDAVNNVYKLMANMDCHYLSTVEDNMAELKNTVPVPEEKTTPLVENHDDPARKVIEATMLKIERMMIKFAELNDKAVDSLLMRPPRDRSSQPYSQWTTQLRSASRDIETGKSTGTYGVDVDEERAEMARSLNVMADQLFRYNAALEIHQAVRIKDVIEYLSDQLGHPCQKRNGMNVHVPSEQELHRLFTETKQKLIEYEQQRGEDPRHTNPNLTALSRTLVEQLSTRGQDSRIIIFVRTRATCQALVNWFNEDHHIPDELMFLKANIFTGAGAKEQEGGMTQVEQEEVLCKFRAGTVKVLVATSVAEEGLDIPECNITLRYNHVGNEVTTIQTRGRTRKAGGISVLLGNNQIRRREMLNVTRADMMSRAVAEIRSKPIDRNLRVVLKHQQEILEEEEIKELVACQKKAMKLGDAFTLQCTNCRTFAINGKDLRLLCQNQHVVVDKDFMQRVNVIRFKTSKVDYDDIKITGSIQCARCHKPWGVMFIHKGMSFSSLKIDYFNVMNQNTVEQSHYKSWKKFPFRIAEMSHMDFKRHLGVGDDSESDDDF